MYVLDTNILIYLFKGEGQVSHRMNTVSSDLIAIPSVVLFEIYVGIAKSTSPDRRIRLLNKLLSKSSILSLDESAARSAAQIRAQLEKAGQPISPCDVLIAGTAMSKDATLVTHNVREFSRVEGLFTEDWY